MIMKTLHTIFTNFAKRNLSSLRLLLVMLLTITTNVWGAEDDTYDFPQNISVSLNNCATFDDIELPEQDYPIKEVIITYAYNKSASPKAIVTIDNEEIGTKSFTGTGNLTTYNTLIFSLDSPLKGSVIISNISASGCTGTGKGTLKITNVTLVEGAPAAPCTVTLMDDNTTLTQSSAGESVDLPSRDGCDGYTFAGWTKSWNDPQTSWTTTAPTIIPAGSYTPTANESLYPVYTKTEGGTPVPATLTASYTSNSGWTATNCGGSSYWVLKNDASITSPVISDLSTVTSITFKVRTYGGDSYKTVNVSTSGGTSIGSASASSTTLTLKTINVSPKLSGSGSIVFSSNTTNTSYGPGINEITINYSTGGSTTYYISVPDCCTQLAEVTNLKFSSITSNSITVAVPDDYSDKANASGYTFNCYSALTGGSLVATDDENGTSHTFTGLTKNTTYYFTVIAKGEGDYCNSVETSARESSKTLTQYTITLNPNGGTGDFSGWSNYTMTVDAGTEITLPELSKTGYDFDGWHDGTEMVTSPYTPTTDITLTAQWTAQQYNIIYKDQGDKDFSGNHTTGYPTKHTYGTATTLKDATKIGYTFEGWYTDDACTNTNKVTTLGATDYTGAITLYAKWTEKALTRYRTDCDACIPLDGYASIDGTYHFFPGETITLTVTPPEDVVLYTYQWQKLVVSEWDDLEGATTTTYTKTEATIEDVGHYRCVVSAEGYCDAIAEYNVKCLQLNVYYNDHTLAFTTPLEKVDATTAIKSVNLENANYQYYFEITDGCENFYGFNGYIHSGWYENVELNAMNSSTHCGLQTTKFGTYIFTVDHSYLTDDNKSYPVVTVTYPSALQEANKVIYLDNHVLDWTNSDNAEGKNKIYYRIGHENHNSKTAMTLVPGTANLYKVTTSEYNNFAVWHIANNGCWSEDHPIYNTNTKDDWAATQATAFETLPVTLESVTVTPTTSIGNGGEDRNSNCEFFNYDITEGMKTWNAEVIEPINGTITVEYTHHDGTEVNDFTSGTRDLAHTCLLTITATADEGYSLASLTVNDVPFTSGNTHTLTKDAVIKAEFTINTHTVTWKPAGGNWDGDASDIVQEYEYGAVIEAPEKPTFECYEFVEWTPTYNAEMTMPDEDLVFTATWNKLSYNITFQNWDGSELQSSTVECGETPTYTGATPTREQTAQYTYTFKGWSPTIAPATQDQVYTAQFDEVTRSYTVTWMVGTTEYTAGTPTNQVEYDKKVTNLPTSPQDDAIGTCANKLMGWSTKSSGSNAENADYYDDLFTTAENSPAITDATTFYAVFATEEETTGGTVEATLSFANTTQRTSFSTTQQVWEQNGITFTHDKASGEDIRDNYAPIRCYKNSKITITHTSSEITKIVFDCNTNDYATALKNSIGTISGATVSYSSDKVTVSFTNAVTSFAVTLSSGQVRMDALTVTAGGGTITTYSNYVTNCCALAPATNLTVAGTTANSATLTWTAPSPTTGITKLQVQVRDENGIVKVDDLAADATTATIIGLLECTEYTFCIASVGEDCEVVSNIVTAQPYGGAKTVNYDYNGGSGSVTSFTTSCTNQTITLPAATRTGYTFEGWYTAATGGTRVGDAGETYEPVTSPVTLYAQWTINQYTVTWNPNGGNWDGSTSNIVQTYEYGAAIDTPEDPKRENGIFKGWSPNPESTMPASNQIYTAQWDMVYTLTFVDMNIGGITRTLTQASSGQNIVAPTANSEVCDMWTFSGWAPSNSLNGGTDKPTGFIAAGETISGSQITENKTYYSVYSYNSDNTQEFEIGKSGTYLMYAISGTTKYYATTARTGGFYGNPETAFATYGYPSKFKLTYNKTENKYIIYHENTTSGKESSGYFELNTSNGDVDVKSETPSLFTIQAGSNGAFIIRTDYNTSPRSFGYDGNFTDYSGDNPIYFEPASEIQYYNAANCGEVDTYTMSFHNPFGDENALIWYDAEHEESYYTDKPLNTSIDVFPTMVYNGWAFIGWTANQQYNELIGEDNLDDENSATDNPASSFTIYSNTTGWAYTLNSNVTMYPVFTKYEDNEDIDLGSGGEYYMYFYREGDYYKDDYFGADNHYQRMYALAGGGDNGEFGYTTNCNNAQIFEFIKEGDGWNIRVKNADGTYPTKSYLVNTSENDYDLVAAKPSSTWSITKEAEGDFTMWYRGNTANSESNVFYQAKAREYSGGSSWNFKCYNQDNNASQYYYKVYLGTCENRVFSSNPTNKPAITLSGEPIVTSTQDQSIRAQGELSISATKLAVNGTITLTADNADIYFSSVKDANFTQAIKPVASLTLMADEKGKLATTTVYVHYKPTSTSNLGILTATITATTGTEGEEDYATAETTAHVRNLPAKFVIATKVGATWYALPADMTTASNPLGVVIEVDETNMTATAPNSCTYTLFPVKTTNTEYDRYEEYGDRLRFSAVNNSYKGLWANNSKTDLTINNDMVIDQASDGQTGSDLANNSYYEWKVTTTVVDGHWQYTLQTDQTQNQNYLRYWTSAEGTPVGPKWGTYNAGENKLYFLPVTETQPFEYDVVEWYPTKMLIQTDAAITSPTVKVRGEEVATPVLTSKGGKLYEISNLPLETNPNEVLQVSFTADAVNYVNAKVVPIILSREAKSITGEPFATLTQKVYQYADVVVRDGATLTIDGGTDVANTLLGMTIYPTAKVSVAEGKKLSVHNLTFFGGIDEIYDGSAYTINKYGVPQLSLKGILNKTVTNMDYIMRVDLEQMYQVGVPYNVDLYDITYWDGTTMTLGDNLYVSAYDGQKRANREEKSWVWETDFTEKVLKAGIGYTISADKQDAAHEYSIIRMPMKNNITSGNTETAKTVQVYAYDNTKGVEITDNHKGWNYLSNPYMVAISGAEADSKLVVGYLRETGTGPWEWVDDTYRYVTIPSDDGKWYDQQKFEEATLLPFKSFFLQIARDGELSFALASRQNAPARYLQSSNEQREVEFEVLLANDTRSDNLGFLIGEDYTPAYEINADLEKMIGSMSVYTIYNGYNLAYNALSPANAEEQIPIGYVVPIVGEYTFALDESSDIEDVEHIYLIDYETSAITDLVTDVYTFTTLEQKSDTRFAINVALKSKDNAATGLDNMNTNGELPTKFIYQDKIFILHHGVIYDATGKRVITINK